MMVDDRLFGQHRDPDQNMGTMKFLQGIQNYTSLLYLGANPLTSIQNTMYGRIATSIESMSGGMISSSASKKAKAAYWREGNFGEMMSDWRRQTSDARVHQILDMFDGMKDFSSRRNDYGRKTATRQFAQADLMMQGHMSGEHYVQSVVALAVLADTLVMNEKDEYLNAQGEVVESPKDALTLLDAFQKNAEGKLIVSDVVKKIEWRGHIKSWATEEQMYSKKTPALLYGENEARTFLTERMQGLNTMIHGAYGDRARAEYERYWQFRSATQMRKWLIMGFKRRWIVNTDSVRDWREDFGARTESGKKRRKEKGYKQLWERDLGYEDFDLAIVNEGMYITMIKYISALANAVASNEHSFGNAATFRTRMGHVWETFNSHQRANVQRFGFESLMMFTFIAVLPAILAAIDVIDDDDEPMDVFAGMEFTFLRMSVELGMYYSIPNLLSTIQNPAIVLGSTKNVYNFITQLFTPWETYTSGSRSGQLKLGKKTADLIPGVRAIHNLFYIKDKMNYVNINK